MIIPNILLRDYDISNFSAFKTALVAKYFFEVNSLNDIVKLREIYEFSLEVNLPILFLGGGTNYLFACDFYEGIIIRNRYMGTSIACENGVNSIKVNSSESVNLLSVKLYDQGIHTLVPWIGLPGTMGGATVGNAGCFGLEMSEIFIDTTLFDLQTGEFIIYKKEDMLYSYRESILKGDQRFFVVSTTINLALRGGPFESYLPDELRKIRKSKQPIGLSCGSFFKNPIGYSAGKLIDDAGLKGTRIGGVKVSQEHGNFFINDEKAKWNDVISLRDLVKTKVFETSGVHLEEEVRIIFSREVVV